MLDDSSVTCGMATAAPMRRTRTRSGRLRNVFARRSRAFAVDAFATVPATPALRYYLLATAGNNAK